MNKKKSKFVLLVLRLGLKNSERYNKSWLTKRSTNSCKINLLLFLNEWTQSMISPVSSIYKKFANHSGIDNWCCRYHNNPTHECLYLE